MRKAKATTKAKSINVLSKIFHINLKKEEKKITLANFQKPYILIDIQ